ncbi:MAG: HAD hydrolase-like protein, partial [Bacillota bacterium]|nr:HAD hydrolase-like protein [Bacillota bacterium]
MKIDAVVFDLDGTLADTLPLTIYALKEAAYELSGILYSDEELIKEFGPTDTEIIKKLVNFKFNDTASDIYVKHFETNFAAYIKPIEGIDKLLGFIKNKGIKLGLFTGRSRRVTEIILQKLGFSDLFDVLITGDE